MGRVSLAGGAPRDPLLMLSGVSPFQRHDETPRIGSRSFHIDNPDIGTSLFDPRRHAERDVRVRGRCPAVQRLSLRGLRRPTPLTCPQYAGARSGPLRAATARRSVMQNYVDPGFDLEGARAGTPASAQRGVVFRPAPSGVGAAGEALQRAEQNLTALGHAAEAPARGGR